jgi:hypothetical protein
MCKKITIRPSYNGILRDMNYAYMLDRFLSKLWECTEPSLQFISEVKWLGHEADCSVSSAKVKNVLSHTSIPLYVCMMCLIKHRDKFILPLL